MQIGCKSAHSQKLPYHDTLTAQQPSSQELKYNIRQIITTAAHLNYWYPASVANSTAPCSVLRPIHLSQRKCQWVLDYGTINLISMWPLNIFCPISIFAVRCEQQIDALFGSVPTPHTLPFHIPHTDCSGTTL